MNTLLDRGSPATALFLLLICQGFAPIESGFDREDREVLNVFYAFPCSHRDLSFHGSVLSRLSLCHPHVLNVTLIPFGHRCSDAISEYGMNVVHLRDYSYLSYAASSRCLPGYLRMLQQHSLSEQMANFVSDHLHQVHVILCDYKLQGILVTAERFDLPVVSVFSDNDPGPLAHYDEHRQVSLPLQMLEKVSLYSLHSWRKLTRHSFGLADLADDTDSFYTEYSGRFPFIVLNERSSPNGTFPSTMQPRFLSLPGLTDGNLSVERDAMPLVQFMKSVAARKFSDLMPIYGYEVVSLKFLLMHHFSLLFVLSLCCVLTAVILFTLLFRKRKQKTD